MISHANRVGRWRLHTSPWLIIGSVIILLFIVVAFAYRNYSREKNYMSRILSEKGVALIKAVEAGTRTGMMGMGWGVRQAQALLEETAQLPDVQFLAVVNRNGLVLADSDRNRIGSHFNRINAMTRLGPRATGWQIEDLKGYGRTFVVYSCFMPIADSPSWMNNAMHRMMHGLGMGPDQGRNWCLPSSGAGKDRIIMVGLNPKPFEEARREDIRNTIIIAGVLVVLGLAGFISMFWMHSYRSTKQALQDTTAFADEVVTSLPVGLIATDKEGRIAFYNSAAERVTGIDLSDALGKDPDHVLPPYFCQLKETLNRGGTISGEEMECEFTTGTVVPVSVTASKIVNEEDRFVGQVLILRDLGEVRRLQAEIRRKEKLAAIGGLAAGVAHEIRNPLSSIKGIASYYKSKFKDGSEDQEMAGVMIQEVDRLSRVISELLEFARPPMLKPQTTLVNDLLAHSVRLVQQEAAAKHVDVQLVPFPGSVAADVDPDRFTQCLLNLYLNALQAMGKGGRLTIAGDIGDGGMVRIDIKDTGAGIPAGDLNKIFDPYFTTKPKGTGLGLAIVYKIIEAHQGSVKVRSAPGQGSVFSIHLPLASPT
jgi:two-component system, NtrC family, sensor histidine kinase HydH